MRYRKRIKIAPGLNINISKTGLSTTIGPRGANINIGKSGPYLNTGIPGTGLYNRTKITSSKNSSIRSNSISDNKTEVKVEIDLNEEYKPVVKIYDNTGRNITNETVVNRIKKTPEYKENLQKLYIEKHNEINDETSEFTDLYKRVLKPHSKEEVQDRIDKLRPAKYRKKIFKKPIPSSTSIEKILLEEAEDKFKSILFWKNKKKIKQFIEENLNKELKVSIDDWEIEKEKFESLEQLIEKESNLHYNKIFEEEREGLLGNLNSIEKYVLKNFEEMLNEINIKPEFFIDFEYDELNKVFSIDLDLPEIEDLPKVKASLLQSGNISVKQKTDKQLREEYAKCVTGLGLLVAGVSFMSSAGIEKVNISGYTQRINSKNGQVVDDYIYSIQFEREVFSCVNFSNIDPVDAIQNFNYKMELSKSFIFKTIEI